MDMLNILIYLAEKGGLHRPVSITTSHLGIRLGISQQSTSRWLMSLEKKNCIERTKGVRGYIVQITPEGRDFLKKVRNDIDMALNRSRTMIIRGRVFSGMGEGQYYIGLEGYRKGIEKKLGIDPYPGTLNIKLKTLRECQFKEKLSALKGTVVPSFRSEKRTFGFLKCFSCSINGTEGAVVMPERSHYGNDVIEIVASENLREKLGIDDGDDIEVEVRLNEDL